MKSVFLRHSVLLAVCLLMPSSVSAFAQTVKVSGTVVDETGLSVIGAGVIQKGTTNGVATDLDGKFTINVPAGAILEFSALNYVTQELPAVDGMKVVLVESIESLNELVVVGYGVQRKSDLTGAISTVRESDIVSRSDADYIKTSTGFSTAGATFEDVALMARNMKNGKKIKAAGGIATLDDASRFLELGAERLGTSRIVKLVQGLEAKGY